MSANLRRFNQMQEMLSQLRGQIDDIDGTQFGHLERLFDQIAKAADAVIAVADELECEIDWEAEGGTS